jgi:hypothetical protein
VNRGAFTSQCDCAFDNRALLPTATRILRCALTFEKAPRHVNRVCSSVGRLRIQSTRSSAYLPAALLDRDRSAELERFQRGPRGGIPAREAPHADGRWNRDLSLHEHARAVEGYLNRARRETPISIRDQRDARTAMRMPKRGRPLDRTGAPRPISRCPHRLEPRSFSSQSRDGSSNGSAAQQTMSNRNRRIFVIASSTPDRRTGSPPERFKTAIRLRVSRA